MPLIRRPGGSPPARGADAPADAARQAAADSLRLLSAGTDDERWAAARAAATQPGGTEALQQALSRERNPRVREAMFTSLARIATPASVEAVLPFLHLDDAQVRNEALDALSSMKDVVLPYLQALLRDEDDDVRILSCELARGMRGQQAARLLAEAIDIEQQPNVCAAAVEVLAEIGGSEVLPALARCQERFQGTPFLVFSIKIAADRIRSQSPSPRA